MSAQFKGRVSLDVRDSTADWDPFVEPRAPAGAPNVLFVVWDDMGFGSWDLYGGLIEMPNMRRLADAGVRFTQFHTTALCSPTRSCLLTGRNAQSNGMGTIGEFSDGFPNISCLIPPENGFIPEVLGEHGYNTIAIGKWHLSPVAEMNMGASKRTWPLSRGFDRFYGFLGGLTDQWYPSLSYDNHLVDPPASPAEGYHLSADLADRTIEFIRDAKATAPDKPWFTYFAPGAGHAPHHVAKEWADRYRGVFDMGYERYREVVLENQKRLGMIPAGTELPPINPFASVTGPNGQPWNASDEVQPWDSLSEGERRLFVRQAEVYAGFASFTDHHVGRVLDYLQQSGQWENTIIVALSDNGASAEGGPNGSVNENRWYNGLPENLDENLRMLDELGSESTHPHFSNGWAMAFNTPFKMYKTYASYEGGTADPLLISWPDGISARGETREQYVHAIDIVPTLYDLLDIEAPEKVKGHVQRPIEGASFRAALDDSGAPAPKKQQFYCMVGTRGIWSEGWHACARHAVAPSAWGHFDQDVWELYHLDQDRNQTNDLAAAEPERLERLKALWMQEAERFQALPLDDRNATELLAIKRPSLAGGRDRMTLYPGCAEVPERSGLVDLHGRSLTVMAEVTIDDSSAQGILYSLGARFGGHALYLQDGRLHYVYNWLGEIEQKLSSDRPFPTGPCILGVRYEIDGRAEGGSPTGIATLHIGDDQVGEARIKTQPAYFTLAGEGSCAGRDTGQPVSTDYTSPFTFRGGTITEVVIDVTGAPYHDLELDVATALARD